MTRFAVAQFSAELAVETGFERLRFEIATCDITFGLNSIPTASCLVAVGRDARNVERLAEIHARARELRILQQAEITFLPEGLWDPDGTEWPPGFETIFHGYLTGTGFVKHHGKAYFSASLIHWLSDLNFASSLNGQTHPQGAAHLGHRAVYQLRGSTLQSRPTTIAFLGAEDFFLTDNITQDLWGQALKPFLTDLAANTNIILGAGTTAIGCPDVGDGKNDQALLALEGLEGGLVPYTFGVPLALRQDVDGLDVLLARSIGAAVGQDMVESYYGTTIWDKLVGDFASAFMFSIVPLVNKALVVPFMPGLRQIYNKTIQADEYDGMELDTIIPRPLLAVAVQAGIQAATFGPTDVQGGEITARIGFGGCFAPAGANPKGMILFKAVPNWLANVVHAVGDVLETSGIGSNEAAGGRPVGLSPGEVGGLMSDILGRYAQAMYMFEVLRGRTAIIRGKLRFDIAPGSNIAVQNSVDPLIGTDDDLASNIVGSVLRVSIHLNAETAQAGTAFQLGYVRTESENEDERTSITGHPLYAESFFGAPLVDRYQFPNPQVVPPGFDPNLVIG